MLNAPVPSITEVLKATLGTVSTWMGDRYQRVNHFKGWLALLFAHLCCIIRLGQDPGHALRGLQSCKIVTCDK
jgi:hypothetical protein